MICPLIAFAIGLQVVIHALKQRSDDVWLISICSFASARARGL